MTKDNIVELKKPVAIKDLLTEVLRNGTQQLLTMAAQAEIDEFLSQHKEHPVVQGEHCENHF